MSNQWNSQDVSNATWDFDKLSIQVSIFFKLVDKDASKTIRNGKPQDISIVA